MRNTARFDSRSSSYPGASVAQTEQGSSQPAPTGGWDAYNPLSNMPPENAVELINFFPQNGWVELRRGALMHVNLGTAKPVETLMGYMSQDTTKDRLIAASGGMLFDATAEDAFSVIGPPSGSYGSDRWQFTDFAGVSGSYLWMCNGVDLPQYYDGTAITVTNITVGAGSDTFTPSDIINVTVYDSRLWCVIKNSTQAVYLGVDAIDGDGFVFDVGPQFINGGYLIAIGAWSTSGFNGPVQLLSFFSSQGDVAVYQIPDPTTSAGVNFRGRSEISQPVGYRCLTAIGSDLGVITLDGVLPLSQVLTYDKAALIGASITKNIRNAINDVMRTSRSNFGWQMQSYPRNTMAILNVPVLEGEQQEQYVMNTITGAWARFQGQLANCWEVFLDKPYFGDNIGIVWEADRGAGDEGKQLTASISTAFNYYGKRGMLKTWNMIRPNVTIDQTYLISPLIGLNVDFGTDAALDPLTVGDTTPLPIWDSAIWDQAIWPGDVTSLAWAAISGIGYCASVRAEVSVPWDTSLETPKSLKINGFDHLYLPGAFI